MQAEIAISPTSELPCYSLGFDRSTSNTIPLMPLPGREARSAPPPKSAEAHYLLGRASLELGDDATAIRELEIASRLSPASPEMHFNLAKAYARAKMPEKAERERATFVTTERNSGNVSEIGKAPRSTPDRMIRRLDVTTAPTSSCTSIPIRSPIEDSSFVLSLICLASFSICCAFFTKVTGKLSRQICMFNLVLELRCQFVELLHLAAICSWFNGFGAGLSEFETGGRSSRPEHSD